MQVSILSVCSFVGRLCSGKFHNLIPPIRALGINDFCIGVGSDLLVKRLHANRVWCLVIASLIFSAAQVCALSVRDPGYLKYVSGLTGLAYGFLFGVFPSLVAETFGIHGLSQNWGFMTLAPVFSGNIFNIFYGMVFDAHSIGLPSGGQQCSEGLECYRNAYLVTIAACVLGLIISLWSIHHMHAERANEAKLRDPETNTT
jgi:MFS family permease